MVMCEIIVEIPEPNLSEEINKELARQALRDMVPPYDDDTYGILVEL